MERIAAMPPAISGRMLSWGWRCYQGETVLVDGEREVDADARAALSAGSDLLDPAALALGVIEVSAFVEAREHGMEVSRKRSIARDARFSSEQNTNVLPLRRFADGRPARDHRDVMHNPPRPDEAARMTVVDNLVGHGMDARLAMVLVERLSKTHDVMSLVTITEKMKGRRVANPARYLEQAANNHDVDLLPKEQVRRRGPRAVRRQVTPNRGGAWEFLGWTCLGHPQARHGREGRRKAWRTDAGRISYRVPDQGEAPPSFAEDPGIMEIE